MSENMIGAVVTVVTAIIGVAILAVLVSNQSKTSTVILAGAKGLAGDISAAVSPVTGQTGFGFGSGVGDLQLQ